MTDALKVFSANEINKIKITTRKKNKKQQIMRCCSSYKKKTHAYISYHGFTFFGFVAYFHVFFSLSRSAGIREDHKMTQNVEEKKTHTFFIYNDKTGNVLTQLAMTHSGQEKLTSQKSLKTIWNTFNSINRNRFLDE